MKEAKNTALKVFEIFQESVCTRHHLSISGSNFGNGVMWRSVYFNFKRIFHRNYFSRFSLFLRAKIPEKQLWKIIIHNNYPWWDKHLHTFPTSVCMDQGVQFMCIKWILVSSSNQKPVEAAVHRCSTKELL